MLCFRLILKEMQLEVLLNTDLKSSGSISHFNPQYLNSKQALYEFPNSFSCSTSIKYFVAFISMVNVWHSSKMI